MSQNIHIAIASTTSRPGQVAHNLEQITGFARRAADDNAALLLTPELSVSGYGSYPEVLATAEPAGNGPIYEKLAAVAQETGVVLCAGFVEAAASKLHLSHYAIFPDGSFRTQRKNCIMHNEEPLQPAVADLMLPDHAPRVEMFEVHGVRCALIICADLGIPQLQPWLAERGVQLLLAPTGAGGHREDRVTNEELLSAEGRAKYVRVLETVFFAAQGVSDCLKFRRALAAVNLCGYDGQRYYHVGHGTIINPMGEVAAFFHGLPNLDRQRPMYTHAEVDVADHLAGSYADDDTRTPLQSQTLAG